MVSFVTFARIASICVSFHLGTLHCYFFPLGLLAKFEFPARISNETCLKVYLPDGLRIEHLYDIIPKAQSWLVLNLPVFVFVYFHFNVPLTRITNLVRNV